VLEYEPEELVGTNFFDLIHDEDLGTVHFAFFGILELFHPATLVQFRHRNRDGSFRFIEAAFAKLQEPGSRDVVVTLRSASGFPEVKKKAVSVVEVEATAQATTQAKDRFLAMLAHELRTPLMPISLGVQELQADERFAEARPVLAMIRRNIQLQTRLLEELTDFTTVGHYKVQLRPELLDAHEAIRHVLETCQAEILARHLEIQSDLRARETMVVADSLRLQQVMWNLLGNAIKFSAPGGLISIASFNETPGHLTLQFTDHGVGIAPALLPLIFDAFQQGEQSTPKKRGGLGLGLFIAKGLAEAQHATLTAASAGPGHGATFSLTLETIPHDNIAPLDHHESTLHVDLATETIVRTPAPIASQISPIIPV
jgi:two-component system CheB/CheR fusion protein